MRKKEKLPTIDMDTITELKPEKKPSLKETRENKIIDKKRKINETIEALKDKIEISKKINELFPENSKEYKKTLRQQDKLKKRIKKLENKLSKTTDKKNILTNKILKKKITSKFIQSDEDIIKKIEQLESKINIAKKINELLPANSKESKKALKQQDKLNKRIAYLKTILEKRNSDKVDKPDAVYTSSKFSHSEKRQNKILAIENKLIENIDKLKSQIKKNGELMPENHKEFLKLMKEEKRLQKQVSRLEKKLDNIKLSRVKNSQLPLRVKISRRTKKLVTAIVILIVIIITLIIAFMKYIDILHTDYQLRLQHQQSTSNSEIFTLNHEAEYFSERIDELDMEIEDLNDTINDLKSYKRFMDNHIKVVEDDADKTYHKYGCGYFDDSYFWAYNTEQVINNSNYTRCPYCN